MTINIGGPAAKSRMMTKKKEVIERESTGFIINDYRAKYRNVLCYGTLDSAP